MKGSELGHYGVRVQYDNKRLGKYNPIPIVRIRYKMIKV